jgi:hypothetical protein
MQQRSSRAIITTRIIRPGQDAPPDDDWLDRTVEERIEGVWTLTKLCHAWVEEDAGELRLRRTVGRIQRAVG